MLEWAQTLNAVWVIFDNCNICRCADGSLCCFGLLLLSCHNVKEFALRLRLCKNALSGVRDAREYQPEE